MRYNKPPVRHHQLDRCDVCGDKVQRSDLVRTQVEFLRPKAENWFVQSSYDGTYWVVDTATDEGTVSYGNKCDYARLSLDTSNNFSYVNGVQTWSGNGVFRSGVAALDTSLGTTITFSAYIGPHLENTDPEMSIVMGICNSDGSVKQPVRSWTIKGMSRIWFTETVDNLAAYGLGDGVSGTAFYYYISVTNDGKWWIDNLQFEVNTDDGKPETFVPSNGAYTSNQTPQAMITVRKVCPRCFEPLLSKSERYRRVNEKPVADPVPAEIQEI